MISEFGNNISNNLSNMLTEIHLNHPSVQIEKVNELRKLDKTLTVFKKLITIFHKELTDRIPEMKAACAQENCSELGRIIHRFKSTTYNLGASRAVELGKQIEHALNKELKSHLEISQLITLLEHECLAAHALLVAYLPKDN